MDLRRLEMLVALAEEGTFSRAARRLGVTQPAVSLALRALEDEMRVQLVTRRARRTTLTGAGEVLMRYAQALTRMAREAEDAVRAAGSRPSGRIHIGASSVPGNYVLPARLAAFQKRHPAVQVVLDITDSTDQLERVRDRRVELAAIGMQVADRRLELQRFADDEVVLVAPRKDLLPTPDAIDRADLAKYPLLTREAGSATRQVVEDALSSPLPATLVLGSLEAVKGAVYAGAGLAFLSRYSVSGELARGDLREVKLQGVSLRRALYLVRLRDRASSPVLVALQRFLLTGE